VVPDPDEQMRLAIAEAELARGSTGDNPWVGCVITDEQGHVVARGHTQGPGEDHAEIVALRHCAANDIRLEHATLYSTLEPCSYHGRTPACARAIVTAGVRRVVTGIRDPNPRVDGAGNQILREAGIDVTEDICAIEVTRSLADWIFLHYPQEPVRKALAIHRATGGDETETLQRLRDLYDLERASADDLLARAKSMK
jgi:diaminohydroxyphosphoribosylaminopyrimidine deaminase/5-amino-6-(5-phosphoribosylamino)uracil reductase